MTGDVPSKWIVGPHPFSFAFQVKIYIYPLRMCQLCQRAKPKKPPHLGVELPDSGLK